MDALLFDDTYTGPRWTYGLLYRKIADGPKGWIIFSDRKHPDFPTFGTVDYPFPLTEDQQKHFSLVPVTKS